MRIGSMFSGYGGLDIAVEKVTGAKPAWFCEYESAPSSILKHHWPTVPNLGDVTALDWSKVGSVDIITGGYPCQPFSAAGGRKGENDERHLWPYVREAIRHLRPRFTFLENVAGHRSLGFDQVLADLAEDGMHARWTSVRASHVGAPHHRERLFILATSPDASGIRFETMRKPSRPLTEVPMHSFSKDILPRWEGVVGPAPRFTSDRGRLNPEYPEWMMGLPRGHVTAVPGINYSEQLKVIGNGVCPQQAELALRILLDENNWKVTN